MAFEEVIFGQCRLIRGDCYVLLADIQADALITDPPYGMAFNFRQVTSPDLRRKSHPPHGRHSYSAGRAWQDNIHGDASPFDPTPFLWFPQIILWGAHHYSAALPSSPSWLLWDKRVGTASDHHGDADMAWTNLGGCIRVHRQLWRGLIRAGEENGSRDGKQHPGQKPLALMRWCVEKTRGIVFDPFAGSFTTALACFQLGRPCIAIEIDPYYFDIGCRRLEAAYAQLGLFLPQPIVHPTQATLF